MLWVCVCVRENRGYNPGAGATQLEGAPRVKRVYNSSTKLHPYVNSSRDSDYRGYDTVIDLWRIGY